MEQLYVLVHEKGEEKQEGSHRVAAEIVAGMIRGSKYWTLEMVNELCSLHGMIQRNIFHFSLINFGKNSRRFSSKFVTISVSKRLDIGTHASVKAWSIKILVECIDSLIFFVH
jgi:hypothetical protein